MTFFLEKPYIIYSNTNLGLYILVNNVGTEQYIRTDAPVLETSKVCEVAEKFGEFGVYDLNVDDCR